MGEIRDVPDLSSHTSMFVFVVWKQMMWSLDCAIDSMIREDRNHLLRQRLSAVAKVRVCWSIQPDDKIVYCMWGSRSVFTWACDPWRLWWWGSELHVWWWLSDQSRQQKPITKKRLATHQVVRRSKFLWKKQVNDWLESDSEYNQRAYWYGIR